MSQAVAKDMPRHVAIIMDGNGRWASAKGLPRTAGHKAGIDALRRAVTAATEFGVEFLTIYSFSTENWTRPATEVGFLLELLKRFIRQDVADLHAQNVRIKVIGNRHDLEGGLLKLLEDAEVITKNNTGLTLIVAFNYGGKQELVRAVQKIAKKAARGEIAAEALTLDHLNAALDTAEFPDPDLLIRTGGEKRISNFLLWQLAYAELVFVDTYWPDFDRDVFARAIEDYQNRERRFGGLKAQTA